MMRKRAWLSAALLLAGTAGLHAEEAGFSASLKAEVSLRDLAGNHLDVPAAGQAFNIAVKLTDVVTGQTVTPGLLSWIRPVDEGAGSCPAALQAYRATRRLPPDAVDLNGIVMASLTTEGTLLFVDPKLDLASSNILSAHRLGEMPASVLAHPLQRTLYMSQSKLGRIVEVGPFSKQHGVFAEGLNAPGDLAASQDGGLWVVEQGTGKLIKFDAAGKRVLEQGFTAGAVSLRTSGQFLAAFARQGGLRLINGNTGQPVLELPGSAALRDAVIAQSRDVPILLSLEDDPKFLTVRFLDASGSPTRIPIATAADRIAVSGDGRWVITYSASVQAVSIIDVAAGQLVQGLALEAPVAEVAFTAEDAFLRLADGSAVATVALQSLQRGKEADIGHVPLGAAASGADVQSEGLLLALAGTNSVVAVHPATFAAFIVAGARGKVSSLPQTGVRLRGGIPRQLRVIDRSLRADESGTYTTSALVPQAGAHELVLGTPLQGLATCIALNVSGDKARPAREEVALLPASPEQAIRAGIKSSIDFKLWDGIEAVRISAPVRMRFSALAFGWRSTAQGQASASGITTEVTLPLPGYYVVEVLDLPPKYILRGSPQIEVQP